MGRAEARSNHRRLLLEGQDERRRSRERTSHRGWADLRSDGPGRDNIRGSPAPREWQPRSGGGLGSVSSGLQSRPLRRRSHSCDQGRGLHRGEKRRLDDQPGGGCGSRGGRAAEVETRGRSFGSEEGKREKQRTQRAEEGQSGETKRKEEEGLPREGERSLEGRGQERLSPSTGASRAGGHLCGYRTGPQPHCPREADEEGGQVGQEKEKENKEKEEEEAERFVQRFHRQQGIWEQQRIRGHTAGWQGGAVQPRTGRQEPSGGVPWRFDFRVDPVNAGTFDGFDRPSVAIGCVRGSTSFPPILPGSAGDKNVTPNATGGNASLLCPGSHDSRESGGSCGCPLPTPQVTGGTIKWIALDSDKPVGGGTTGAGYGSYFTGSRGSSKESERGRPDKGAGFETLRKCEHVGETRGMEKRERKERREERQLQGRERTEGRRLQEGRDRPGEGQKERWLEAKLDGQSPRLGGEDLSLGVAPGLGAAPGKAGGVSSAGQVSRQVSFEGKGVDLQTEGPTLPTPEPGNSPIQEGQGFCSLGPFLNRVLKNFELRLGSHSKSQSTAKGCSDVFPLPVSGPIFEESPHPEMLSAACRALNLMYGAPSGGKKCGWSAVSLRVVKYVAECIAEVSQWSETFGKVSFDRFFSTKSIDYKGDEVRVAEFFTWHSIEPALPTQVGQLKLVDFCSKGTLHYVKNFEDYLIPLGSQSLGRPPRVMVGDEHWDLVCEKLVSYNICTILPLDQLHHVKGQPLLSGMFAVGKGDFIGSMEVHRIIMNLIPLNQNCRSLHSDVVTLPGISGLAPYLLEEGEVVLLSSEDIRCFFYLFEVPSAWWRFLGFNKKVPGRLVPECYRGRECVLAARVLPMGFVNSVGIAQHVHRNVIKQALSNLSPPVTGEGEMRKDRTASVANRLYRVYLDNFDQLVKVNRKLADEIQGKPSAEVLAVRAAYQDLGLPRHPRKSVVSETRAEIQGAIVDGERGTACPKPAKVLLYTQLAVEILARQAATQKEMQVICGGMVYFAMFRRPLLSTLNHVWGFIEAAKKYPPVLRMPLPWEVKLELMRFCALIPLAKMDFRLKVQETVTASDASMFGGGICKSLSLTSFGEKAAEAWVRGERPERTDDCQILTVGLFDGIGALRVACDVLELPMCGHISVEINTAAKRVLEAAFPESLCYDDVASISEVEVKSWACRFSGASLVILGAGPPCQGVSGLNADKRGALKDKRSSLFQHVPRIRQLLKLHFPWAQVKTLIESVASMDPSDLKIMSDAIGSVPWRLDAGDLGLARRPRLYWIDWELLPAHGVILKFSEDRGYHEASLESQVNDTDFLEPGWRAQGKLPTFTTSRPALSPGRKPAGINTCGPSDLQRWKMDSHRFPPYQYRSDNCLVNRKGELRVASVVERETIMGFPKGYTTPCLAKSVQKSQDYRDIRLTLLGNSWHVPSIVWLLSCLTSLLGITEPLSPQQVVDKTKPGAGGSLQQTLLRLPMAQVKTTGSQSTKLIRKLVGLVSIKGEDLLLQMQTEGVVRHQRLRTTIPAKLWRWKTVASWQWHGQSEHINALELRAVLTTIKWWVQHKQVSNSRILHLTDSLVVLHSLSRGRSSSRKLRRTINRLNAFLLAANLHPVWTYVHTSLNPADGPSRLKVKKKWVK